MTNIRACRVCFVTDCKLFDIEQINLGEYFELLTGISLGQNHIIHHLCVFCAATLNKFVSFRRKCLLSEDLQVTLQHTLTSEEDLQQIQEEFKLKSYVTTQTNTYHFYEDFDVDTKEIKQEQNLSENNETDKTDQYIDINSSDDEPLLKKIISKKERLNDVKILKDNLINDYDLQENNGDFEDYVDNNIEGDSEVEGVIPDTDVLVMSKEQQIEEIQARKKSLNYLNALYQCGKCYKGFLTTGSYNNHMSFHDPVSGNFECEICLIRYRNSKVLLRHMENAHQRRYCCRICAHISRSKNGAIAHSKWHTGVTFPCNICGSVFTKQTTLFTHTRLKHPSEHSCEECGETFIGAKGLNLHRKKVHRNSQTKPRCKTCEVAFNTTTALENHTCDTKLRSCIKCGDSFESQELLREHLKSHPVATCDICNLTYTNEIKFALHYRQVHLGVRYLRNRSMAAGDQPVCDQCGKTCKSNSTLMYHQRTHTGEKPYQCSQCPKKFRMMQSLQIHTRTHTGERPFKCSHCAKAFKHKAALNRHLRVHTGVKPYSCPHCSKTFSQSNSVKAHVKTVHLKQPAPYRNRRKPAGSIRTPDDDINT